MKFKFYELLIAHTIWFGFLLLLLVVILREGPPDKFAELPLQPRARGLGGRVDGPLHISGRRVRINAVD